MMKQIDYYFIYICLKKLFAKKKITRNVANKILKEYEQEYHPVFRYKFKK